MSDRLTPVMTIEVLVDEDWVGSVTPYRVRVSSPGGTVSTFGPMNAHAVAQQVKATAEIYAPEDVRRVRR